MKFKSKTLITFDYKREKETGKIQKSPAKRRIKTTIYIFFVSQRQEWNHVSIRPRNTLRKSADTIYIFLLAACVNFLVTSKHGFRILLYICTLRSTSHTTTPQVILYIWILWFFNIYFLSDLYGGLMEFIFKMLVLLCEYFHFQLRFTRSFTHFFFLLNNIVIVCNNKFKAKAKPTKVIKIEKYNYTMLMSCKALCDMWYFFIGKNILCTFLGS